MISKKIIQYLCLIALSIGVMIALTTGCSVDKVSEPYENSVPETHLFLSFPDTLPDSLAMPDTSTSTKIVHWYGDDIDGEVVGFYHAWDDTSSDTAWTYTTENMDTFHVPIRETYGEFTFFVKAVDNEGAVDLTPAYITFPIINSPPEIRWPVDFELGYMEVDFVGFDNMTFSWVGTDPDGDETIVKYYYHLGDTLTPLDTAYFDSLEWIELPPEPTSLSLTDLTEGTYRIFMKAQDIASSESEVIYYPDTSGSWEVQEPVGDLLYVDDNAYWTGSEHIYTDILDSMYGTDYSRWKIEERAYYNPVDVITAFSNFTTIVWNGGSSSHFSECSSGINNFLLSGGKIFLATTYFGQPPNYNADSTIYSFMPFDSVTITDVGRPYTYSYTSLHEDYPDLYTERWIDPVFGFIPAAPEIFGQGTAAPLYKITHGGDDHIVATRYPDTGTAQMVMFSFFIHECDGDPGINWILPFVLTEEFAP
ncbi:MAG: hypothetical protein GF315_03135 [candidate division Zixibacteria bacterium]|nr:hypothetical protein [candidate division Zixibacteria bacterium]